MALMGRALALLCAPIAVAALLPDAAEGAQANGSLYSGPGPRPGPDLLYAKPRKAPQLRNRGPWRAKPILISGASAYRAGEFLYQDYVYDDHGAKAAARDAGDPRTGNDTFSAPNGTYTYPTDPAYLENAADLVELRVKPLGRSTAFRLTLNSMEDPGLVAATLALGDSPAPIEFPHGANVSAPAELFLTVHGREAELLAAVDSGAVTPRPRVRVSRRRNQIEVRVPHAAWDPGAEEVRLAAGVGLWDEAAGSYLTPTSSAGAGEPGGAGGLSDPPAFFNAAFRFDEPLPVLFPFADALTNTSWWRERDQGAALAANDLSGFSATVDFGKLEAGIRDDMTGEPQGVPVSGPMNRVLSSRFKTGEGTRWAEGCGNPDDCIGEMRGRLQPYSIYIPEGPRPDSGYGLTLLLHSLGANYNQFAGSRNQSQFGERGEGSIVITPAGRGPDGWYYGHAGADTFEVWADVARRYRLDPKLTAVAGYSMGGYGTYKFTTQYPDLFARAQPTVGPPGLGVWTGVGDPSPGGAGSNTNRMLASVRHIPYLIWNGTIDELVPVAGAAAQAQTFDDLGYRYAWDLFPTADHFELAVNDQYQPAADFLGEHRVDRNPAHVTYVVNPTMDFANAGTVADHAYWLSGLRLRDSTAEAPLGKIDAVSEAFGEGDPPANATEAGPGVLSGGNLGPMVYAEESKDWGVVPPTQKADRLRLELENLKRVVVSVRRARLSCDPDLEVTTDGPVRVRLAGCGRTLQFG
jgi:predicted esterase